MLRKKMIGLTLVLFGLPALGLLSKRQTSPAIEAVPGEYVVKLKAHQGLNSSKSVQILATQLADRGLQLKEVVSSEHNVVLVKADHKSLSLQSDDMIQYIEPNFIYRAQVMEQGREIPDDEAFEKLWGMNNSGQNDPAGNAGTDDADIDAPEAWSINTGSRDLVVAIIDTGIDYTHPDLRANIWSSPDDANVHGYNAINDSLDPMDDHSHGTHCSGTIGGDGSNGVGVAGVNWKSSLMGVKFLSAGGSGSLADAIKAIDWAVDHGAKVLSNSWGGGGYSEAMKESIVRANEKGVLFVAAAGNDGSNSDSRPMYPASYQVENVISVAASTNTDDLAYFSNYGKRTVHLMAPGHNIYSTVRNGGYSSYSGTSMATPHVSGAAALLWAQFPELSHLEIKERLIRSTDKIYALRSKTISSGGRLNINNALLGHYPPALGEVPDDQWSSADVEPISSEHPYLDNTSKTWEIEVPGANYIRLRFDRFDTENRYDKVILKNDEGTVLEEFTGALPDNTWTDAIQGSRVTIEFISDYSQNGYGFDMGAVQSTEWTDEQ